MHDLEHTFADLISTPYDARRSRCDGENVLEEDSVGARPLGLGHGLCASGARPPCGRNQAHAEDQCRRAPPRRGVCSVPPALTCILMRLPCSRAVCAHVCQGRHCISNEAASGRLQAKPVAAERGCKIGDDDVF